jgi:hypothetical protein
VILVDTSVWIAHLRGYRHSVLHDVRDFAPMERHLGLELL